MPEFSLDLISPQHDCKKFKCSKHALDYWLQKYALNNHQANISRTRVLVEVGSPEVLGFYTLSASILDRTHLPEELHATLPPKYPAPAILLAQLAVRKDRQGQDLGAMLIAHALQTCAKVAEDIGSFAIAVEAIDDSAVTFYEHYGFRRLSKEGLHLFLPTATATQVE